MSGPPDVPNKAARALAQGLSMLGLVALMVLATMTMADGIARWLFNQPIEGVRDVGAIAIAFAISCCMPIALVEKSHISIHFVRTIVGERVGGALDALAAVVVAIILCALAWQVWAYAWSLASGNQTTVILRIPVAPFWFAVDVVLWCAVLIQLTVAAGEIAGLQRTRSGSS
ncbi:MAG: TRAP transporter small permease [Burkholderiaceae bacterium]